MKRSTHDGTLADSSSASISNDIPIEDRPSDDMSDDTARLKSTGKATSNQDDDIAAERKRKEGGAEPGAKENFWKWFQESKGNEKKGASTIECPAENKRLCQMFYKFVRKYKIRTIYDVSCGRNFAWMPIILKHIGNELWGLKYHCSETDATKMPDLKDRLSEFQFVEFDDRLWWKAGFPDDIELLFSWDVLAHTAYGRVWNFFVNAKKQNIKFVLVDSHVGILNDPSPKRTTLNLRKHPFRFPAAKEVVQNVTEPGETGERQLLFYEGSALPDNLG
jgi:hypothetical protein